MQAEAQIIIHLQALLPGGWIQFFLAITALASVAGLVLFATIIFFKDKKLSIFYVISFGFTSLFNLILKNLIRRPRPFQTFPQILNIGGEDGYSTPSSHAALAALTAVFVCYYTFKQTKNPYLRTLAILAMLVYVGLIATSRMVLGVHYLSDTLVGIFEGLAMGFVGIKAYESINVKIKRAE